MGHLKGMEIPQSLQEKGQQKYTGMFEFHLLDTSSLSSDSSYRGG